MKHHVALITAALFINNCYSQIITILSQSDKTAVPFALIVVEAANGKKIPLAVTDINGVAAIPPPQLQSTVTISCAGYKNLTDSLVAYKTYYLQTQENMLDEVVITGQYTPNSAERAMHKIKVIDRKKIEAMAAQNLRDVLTNELNIRISQDNILGSGISIQGLSGQNVKVLIDGVPVTGRLNGNIDVSQINLNNTERIEIIEGPMSVNYGSDALAGTINIITKKTQQSKVSACSQNYYESNGQYNHYVRIGYRINKHIITFSGGRNYFDGWKTADKPFLFQQKHLADFTRFEEWKPKEQYFGTLYYGRYIEAKGLRNGALKLGYTSDYFNEILCNKGLPRLPYYETAFDDLYKTYRFNNSVNLSGQLNRNYYTNFMLSYNHYKRIKNTYFKDLTTLQETITDDPMAHDTSVFNTFTTRGSISSTKDSANLNYEIGYDINHEKTHAKRIKNQLQYIGDYALFGSIEYRARPKITVRPGIRLMHNTGYKAPLVPSVHLRYGVNSRANIRLSYARGFRAPSLKDLYFYFVDINHNIMGNENLRAEQSHNFNLSLSYKRRKNDLWHIENSLFYNRINNMITRTKLSDNKYSYINVDKFRTWGLQFQIQLAGENLKSVIGGSYTGRYNQLSEIRESDKFTYTPEGKFNLMYELRKPRLTFSLYYKYTGALNGYALNEKNETVKTKIDHYHTADISVSKLMLKKRLNVAIGSKNLFDVKNISGYSSGDVHSAAGNSIAIGMGRTYFIKLDVNINSTK